MTKELAEREERIEHLRSEIRRCEEAIEKGGADNWWYIDRDRFRQELDDLLSHGAAASPVSGSATTLDDLVEQEDAWEQVG